ncbi:MAG TPA: HPP family protein [Polyangiales bacterium]|nr:HPP family protein [Polyangiales bacterium]
MSLARVDEPTRRVLLASLGAAAFILSLGALDPLTKGAVDLPALMPPFGASTVIVFFAPDSAAGRAWNVVAGHLGSALVATAVIMLAPQMTVVQQSSLAVAGAGIWMVLSKSVHPPGGATALLTALGGHKLGSGAILLPLLAGCLAMLGIRWVLDLGIGLAKGSSTSTIQS